jgi:hypothetical protein
MIEICEPFNNIDILTESIYQYTEIQNVITLESSHNKWIVEMDNNNRNIDKSHYLIIDTLSHEAFFHWVAECAIYLPLFTILKRKYPTLKLYLKAFKTYKKIFCDFFHINQSDIVYNLVPSNICIFPMPISSLNINTIDDRWKQQVDYLIHELTLKCADNPKNIQSILLPRQNKENFKNNDRTYNTTDIHNNIQNSNGIILNTDEIVDLNDQINTVNSSVNVILTGGSPYFMNGLFCKNSHIIVLDAFVVDQINMFIKLKYIHNKICMHNQVFFINRKKGNIFYYNDIKRYLRT